MPITSKNEKIHEDGEEKDALTLTFTNGARQQLEELKDFLKAPDELEVLKLGISILQNFKNEKEKENASKE